MKGAFVHIFVFVACVNCSQWIKLSSPMKKEFHTVENILSFLTPDDSAYREDAFVKLNEPLLIENHDNTTFATKHILSSNNSYDILTQDQIKFTSHTEPTVNLLTEKKSDEALFLVEYKTEKDASLNSNLQLIAPIVINNTSESSFNETTKNKANKDAFTLKKLTQILKTLQQSLFTKIPTGLKDKTHYLKTIHDNILFQIDDKLNKLWPVRVKREDRGWKDDNHLEFLSPETALMTISFLTFAVYLIKLILQIITVLKNKKSMYYPPITATGRSFDGRSKLRGIDEESSAQILRLMESFKH